MPPQLSIIVPYYNHPEGLPRLLDSIGLQSLKSLEVVVVDDSSEQQCDDVIDAYLNKGMNMRLIRCEERQYTKNARLTGIEVANASIIAFADADDILWGTETLEAHVQLMLRESADVVHFNMLNIAETPEESEIYSWARPLASHLEGQEIFEYYVKEQLRGHNIYTKLFSRALCMNCLEAARESSVRRYMEDLFLTSIFLFHSSKYIGSERVGYARTRLDKVKVKIPGRITTLSAMLHEFIPYIVERGCLLHTAEACSSALHAKLRRWVIAFYANQAAQGSMSATDIFLPHATETAVLKAFLSGHPCMQLAMFTRQNEELRDQIQRETLIKYKWAIDMFCTIKRQTLEQATVLHRLCNVGKG